MLKIMELGKLKHPFEKWAKVRQNFNYNKYTSKLICHGKEFSELLEPMQHSAILTFLDNIGITICVAPVYSLDHWSVVVLYHSEGEKIQILYEHPEEDKSLGSRFTATQFGINWYVEYLNRA